MVRPGTAWIRLEVLDLQGRVRALAYEGTVAIPWKGLEPGLKVLRMRADRRIFAAKVAAW